MDHVGWVMLDHADTRCKTDKTAHLQGQGLLWNHGCQPLPRQDPRVLQGVPSHHQPASSEAAESKRFLDVLLLQNVAKFEEVLKMPWRNLKDAFRFRCFEKLFADFLLGVFLLKPMTSKTRSSFFGVHQSSQQSFNSVVRGSARTSCHGLSSR